MKQLLWVFLFFISPLGFSQSYSLRGVVMNESNLPVEAVVCVLQKADDSLLLKTVISNPLGEFEFNDIPRGDYMLVLQHMAYEKESHSIFVNNSIELAPFVLLSLSKLLNEVVVSGERPVVKAVDGKLVYDIPQLIKDKAVSNAFETLQNVPSVTGVGDELQLIGSSGYTILINGQQTSMSKEQIVNLLKSIPASRMSDIEIMYSAPPQYNIRGAAINIILKGQTAGTPTIQGEGNAEYKQAFYAGYGLRGNLLFAKSSFNADLTVGIGQSKGWGLNDMYAKHHFDGHTYDITQQNRFQSDRKDLNLRLGLGYTFANNDRFRLVYTAAIDDTDSKPVAKTVFLKDKNPFSDVTSLSNKDGNSYLHNMKIEYNSHKNLNMGVDYTIYRDPATEKYSDYSNGDVLQTVFKTKTNQKVDKVVAFINHSISLKNEWKLDYGGNISSSKNNNLYDYYRNPEGQAVDSINNSTQKEYSASMFAGFSKSFGDKLSVQASLSVNYFRATIDIMDEKKTLWNDFQPFVNANLTYTYNPRRILQLSLSSDISYPPYWALSNDVVRINAYSMIQGNPELKFSRDYKAQLNFIMNQKYVIGGYYEYKPDRYIQLSYQSQEALQNVFQMVNLNYEKQFGVFFVVPLKIDKIWDARATVNLIRQEEKDDDFYDVPYVRSKNSFVVQLRNTINISSRPDLKLDVSGFYMHGALQGIYDIGRMWNVASGVKWTFLDNRAELMFRVEDVFKSGKQTTRIDYMNQYSTMNIKPNVPVFKLSFTYRFGNYKKSKVEDIDTSRFGR